MLNAYEPDDVARALLDPTGPAHDPVIAAIHLLMTGFGYNFYDARNVARANDQLVRQKASGLLADAARTLARLEFAYREECVPPASREQPFPPDEVTRPLKKLAAAIRRLGDDETRIRSLETPGNDYIWFRVRDEQSTLQKLLAADVGLVVGAATAADHANALTVDSVKAGAFGDLTTALDALGRTIDARRALIQLPA